MFYSYEKIQRILFRLFFTGQSGRSKSETATGLFFASLLLRNGALHLECLPFGNYLHDLLLVQCAICYKILIDGFCEHVE